MALPKIRNNAENKGIYKPDIYEEFKQWFALPSFEKRARGVSDQNTFAERYGVNKDTLTRWKNRRDFEAGVRKYIENEAKGRTSGVIEALYRSAMKGNSRSIRLWLTYVEGWHPNRKQKEVEYAPLIREEDIFYHISFLPEDLKEKYTTRMNELLRDVLSDLTAFNEGRLNEMSNSPNYDGL